MKYIDPQIPLMGEDLVQLANKNLERGTHGNMQLKGINYFIILVKSLTDVAARLQGRCSLPEDNSNSDQLKKKYRLLLPRQNYPLRIHMSRIHLYSFDMYF